MSQNFSYSILRIFFHIILLNSFFQINSDMKIIVLPFKTLKPKIQNASTIIENPIYTNINMTSQNLLSIFSSSEYEYYMTSENCPSESNYYIYKSKTFTKLSDSYASERMSLYRDIELKKQSYGIFTKMKIVEYNNKVQCAIFGLQMNSRVYDYNSRYNFIRTFKSNENINSTQWTFKYTKEDEGILILGESPINYDPDFKNKKYNLYQTKAVGKSDFVDFGLDFDDISINNNSLAITHVQFCHDFNAILVNKNIFEQMDEIFFKKYLDNGICTKGWVYDKYGYIECDSDRFKEDDMKKFPTIFFKKVDMGYIFELTYEDLFSKNINGKIYFLIVFDLHFSTMKIGKLFLKKYPFTVDNDKNTISLYVLDDGNNNNNTNKKSIALIVILVCAVVILLGVAGFLLYKLYLKKNKNKKRANELDEDYEYLSKENNENNENNKKEKDNTGENNVGSLGI